MCEEGSKSLQTNELTGGGKRIEFIDLARGGVHYPCGIATHRRFLPAVFENA